MTKKVEVRTYNTAIRAAGDNEFVLEGTALTYGALSADLGGFRERFDSHAFDRHLKSAPDVHCCFNHSADVVLGRTGNNTLTLDSTPTRLNYRCQLNPESQAHKDLYASIRRGDIHQCSFSFVVDGDDGEVWDNATDEKGQRFARRTVMRALLKDVAPVTSPAYPGDATNVSARTCVADYSVSRRQPTNTIDLRHGKIAAQYKYLNYEQIKIAVRDNYSVDTLNRLNLAELTKRMPSEREAQARALKAIIGEPMTANEVQQWRNRFAAAPGANSRSVEGCPGSGICTDPKDHERAAGWHTNKAHNAKDLPHAEAHYRAEMFHSLAAQDPSAENCTKAQGHCKRASDIDEKNEEL